MRPGEPWTTRRPARSGEAGPGGGRLPPARATKTSSPSCKSSRNRGTTLLSHRVEGGPPMLMRTDPFRELDRLTQQVFGTASRPTAMPMDAYRKDDSFLVQF